MLAGYCAAVAGAPAEAGNDERGVAVGVRAPVPDAAAQANAEKLIHEVFGNYAAAAAGTRAATAAKMLDQAAATQNDAAARYMLLKDSASLAAAAGDAATAMRGVATLNSLYDVDGLEMRCAVIRTCAVAATTPQAAGAVANEGLSAAGETVAAGNFDVAGRLLAAIEPAARISTDKPLMATVTSCIEYLRWIQSQVSADQLAVETLAKSPSDADANLVHGLFLCFGKNDWDDGLRAIAKGPNDGLKAAALKDLSNPTAAGQQAAAGNAWWESAEREPPEEYDLQIDFARRTGNDFFGAICPLPHGGSVAWFAGGWGNHAICFAHFINGGWFVLTAHDVGVAVANGQHYSVTIRMRRESARAYHNGELVSEMPSNNKDLRAGQDEVGGKSVIGLTIDPLSSAMIYKMELTEVTGRGQHLPTPGK